jgi:hypothetical protein
MSDENDVEAMPAESVALVSQLAAEIRSKVERIDALAEEMKREQAALLELETKRLPDAMGDLGFTSLRLDDGSTIAVAPEYHCQISKAKRAEAHAVLRDRGFGDLIKSTVWAEFGKGEEAQASEFFARVRAEFPDRPTGLDEGVHPATLKALVKEQYESGDPLPEDLFGVFILQRATIQSPKLKTKSRK